MVTVIWFAATLEHVAAGHRLPMDGMLARITVHGKPIRTEDFTNIAESSCNWSG